MVTRMLKTPQAFDLVTEVAGWNEKYLGLRHTFERRGRPHAQINMVARIADKDDDLLSTQDVLEAIGLGGEIQPLPELYNDLIERIEAGNSEVTATQYK